jgi:glucose 1-dehydrogenase
MAGALAGKVAVVTGASSGIGEAAAVKLAEAGADVTMTYHSGREKAEATAAQIKALGRKVIPYQIDVSDQSAVEAMVAETVKRLGRVDVFVSSAVYSDREPFLTADMKGFRRTLEVSMFGAYYCLRACCNQMVRQDEGGSAVIVSSPHARIAFPNAMAYNMAKAAIDQMARTAACELLPHRIRVNICYPGWTDTPGERKFFSEETIQKASKSLPWGRLATSEEVARAIVFLADPASDYITGEILHVDGGLFLPWWSKRDTGDF